MDLANLQHRIIFWKIIRNTDIYLFQEIPRPLSNYRRSIDVVPHRYARFHVTRERCGDFIAGPTWTRSTFFAGIVSEFCHQSLLSGWLILEQKILSNLQDFWGLGSFVSKQLLALAPGVVVGVWEQLLALAPEVAISVSICRMSQKRSFCASSRFLLGYRMQPHHFLFPFGCQKWCLTAPHPTKIQES